MKAPVLNQSTVRFDIAPHAIALLLATVAGVWLAFELRIVVLMVVVALIVAGTLNPLVEWMEKRGIRRLYALILLIVVLAVCAAFLLFLTLPPLIEQLTQMMQSEEQTSDLQSR